MVALPCECNYLVPPTSVQDEIVNHITNLRQKAKTLQAEASAILENVKKQIEATILGDNIIDKRVI